MIKDFKVEALPTLFVFDKNLRLVLFYRGFNKDKPAMLEKRVLELLR